MKVPRPSTIRVLCAVLGWTPRDVMRFTRRELAIVLLTLRSVE